MVSSPKLSVVIPAYNEAIRLKKTLPEITDFFRRQKYSKEIIIVNDGSGDATASLVTAYAKKHPLVRLLSLKKNHGKGGALRAGVAQSRGQWILFMDADLSTPLNQLEKFWPYTNRFDVIIGSRKMTGAKVLKHQSLVRENLGKVFTLITNLLATKGITDSTCGFKLFKGPVGRALFSKSLLNDWSFDAEILFLAQKYRHRIREVPVSWHNDPRTKVNIFSDGLNAFSGLIKIRCLDLLGRY